MYQRLRDGPTYQGVTIDSVAVGMVSAPPLAWHTYHREVSLGGGGGVGTRPWWLAVLA